MCGTATMALAQITEGEPSAKKVRTGNRPEAGNFGLYIGVGSKFTESNISLTPIINFKYMKTYKLEFRDISGGSHSQSDTQWNQFYTYEVRFLYSKTLRPL